MGSSPRFRSTYGTQAIVTQRNELRSYLLRLVSAEARIRAAGVRFLGEDVE